MLKQLIFTAAHGFTAHFNFMSVVNNAIKDCIRYMQHLEVEQDRLKLAPGMQVSAEIKLADQTVME